MKRWYQQFWPWALMAPPLLAVAGGVTMLVLATHTPGALVVADYARIEELTSERFARDEEAVRRGIAASIEFSAERVELTLDWPGNEPVPDELVLRLQHATDAAQDRELTLHREGGRFTVDSALLPGRYRLELMPPDRGWRLASALLYPYGRIDLEPQHAGG